MVAVIVALPPARPVTTPAAVTVATEASEDVQVIFLSVAFEGATVAVSVELAPAFIARVVFESLIEVVGTTTFTTQTAVCPPSSVVTEILQEPTFVLAVTLPVQSTVATEVSLLFHVIFLFVA